MEKQRWPKRSYSEWEKDWTKDIIWMCQTKQPTKEQWIKLIETEKTGERMENENENEKKNMQNKT